MSTYSLIHLFSRFSKSTVDKKPLKLFQKMKIGEQFIVSFLHQICLHKIALQIAGKYVDVIMTHV